MLVTFTVPGMVIEPAVKVAESPTIEPETDSATPPPLITTGPLPTVASTAPETVSATASLTVKPLAAVVANAPKVPIWLVTDAKFALSAAPLSVPTFNTPADWVTAPVSARKSIDPAVRFAPSAIPPLPAVRLIIPVAPALTAPLTVIEPVTAKPAIVEVAAERLIVPGVASAIGLLIVRLRPACKVSVVANKPVASADTNKSCVACRTTVPFNALKLAGVIKASTAAPPSEATICWNDVEPTSVLSVATAPMVRSRGSIRIVPAVPIGAVTSTRPVSA